MYKPCSLFLLVMSGLCGWFSSHLLAQGPTLIDPVELVESEGADELMVAEWLVTNATENPLTLYVERHVLQAVEPFNLPYVAVGADTLGARERFCWGGSCFNWGTDTSPLVSALTLNPGDTTGTDEWGTEFWLTADYDPLGVEGTTVLEYCLKATQQGVPEVCHAVQFCAGPGGCVLAVEEKEPMSLGSMAPNPVTGISAVSYDAPQGGRLLIVDLTGRTVKSTALAPGSGSVWIDGQELAPGTYLYALEVEGRIGQVRKFSVSR